MQYNYLTSIALDFVSTFTALIRAGVYSRSLAKVIPRTGVVGHHAPVSFRGFSEHCSVFLAYQDCCIQIMASFQDSVRT